MRSAILQASLFSLLLSPAALADLGASQVIQVVKRIQSTVAWDSTSIVRGDFNGDGRQGAAILGIYQQRVFVAVVLYAPRKLKAEILALGIGTHSADSICELPAKLVVEPLECSPLVGPLPGCRPSSKAVGLVLFGGECDPINFYWNHQSNKLAWWRV